MRGFTVVSGRTGTVGWRIGGVTGENMSDSRVVLFVIVVATLKRNVSTQLYPAASQPSLPLLCHQIRVCER